MNPFDVSGAWTAAATIGGVRSGRVTNCQRPAFGPGEADALADGAGVLSTFGEDVASPTSRCVTAGEPEAAPPLGEGAGPPVVGAPIRPDRARNSRAAPPAAPATT